MSLVDHDQDFFLWTRQQADALRRLADTRPNVEIDWNNLIEEIEDLGSEQEHAVKSYLKISLVHLLALARSPDENPRQHWMGEVLEQRDSLEERVARNPSLKPRLPLILNSAYRYARKRAALKLAVPLSALPESCPFTLEQVLDEEWLPERNVG